MLRDQIRQLNLMRLDVARVVGMLGDAGDRADELLLLFGTRGVFGVGDRRRSTLLALTGLSHVKRHSSHINNRIRSVGRGRSAPRRLLGGHDEKQSQPVEQQKMLPVLLIDAQHSLWWGLGQFFPLRASIKCIDEII